MKAIPRVSFSFNVPFSSNSGTEELALPLYTKEESHFC